MGTGQNGQGNANIATITNGTNEKKYGPGEFQTDSHPRRPFLYRHAYLITLVVSTMVDGLLRSVSGQYRYRFFTSRHQHELDQYNVTKGKECGSNSDERVKAITDTISKETAQWNLYENFVMIVPLFIASVFIGMKSDQIGRRFLYLLSITSTCLYAVVIAVVIRLKIHFGWVLIGSFLSACSGSRISMFYAAFALVSDTHGKRKPPPTEMTVTPNNPSIQDKDKEKNQEKSDLKAVDDDDEMDASREKARTYKIVAVDVVRRLASSIVAFVTGYIIKNAGFFYTMIIVVIVKVLLFGFAYIFVTETGQQKKSIALREPLRTIGRALKDPVKGPILILCNLGLFFLVLGFVDEFEILHVYQMSPPFCFDSVKLGWIDSEGRLKGLFSMPLMWLWKRLHFSEAMIALIGTASNVAATLVLATIRYSWVFFAIPVIGIPGTLCSAVVKAVSSRLIGRAALASTFALMVAGEEVFWIIGSLSSNYLYESFVSTVPTAPFYMASASFFVASLIFFIMEVKGRRSSRQAPTDPENDTKM